MLVLIRKTGESIRIGEDVTLVVLNVQGNKVRLGVNAPRDMPVDREELRERKRRHPRPPTGATGGSGEDEE